MLTTNHKLADYSVSKYLKGLRILTIGICIIICSIIYVSSISMAATTLEIDTDNAGNTTTITVEDTSSITFDDETITNDTFPAIRINNIWMVPAKEFCHDILGCTYDYDNDTFKLTLTNPYNSSKLIYTLGSTTLTYNGTDIIMGNPVMKATNSSTAESTLYVPAAKSIPSLGFGYVATTTKIDISTIVYYSNTASSTNFGSSYSNALTNIIYSTNLSSDTEYIETNTAATTTADNTTFSADVENYAMQTTYLNTKNSLGDIDETFTIGFISEIKVWESDNNTYVKVWYNNKYAYAKSVNSNGATITLSKGTFSIKVLLPDGVDFDKITTTDQYWNKKFIIFIPGNYVSYYKIHKPVDNSSAVSSISVAKTSDGYTKLTVKTTKLRGYKLTNKDGYFNVKVGSPKSIYKNIVLLDAGHGGKDTGATYNGTYEKNLNLKILYTQAQKYFESSNSNVKAYWTRHDDTFVNLYTRPKLSATYNADLFVSLHMNSSSNRAANGTEVYYSSQNNKANSAGLTSKKMAKLMLNDLLGTLGSNNRGVKQAGFVVNKYNSVPSILIELGFINGSKDSKNLKKASYQEKAAKTIYTSISEIFEQYPTGR